ncbi:hypothetical protein WISP_52090 [Willisornis vidua]|uniref:Uncharacterized protein n=1 Tax=Willisornis vidua TaxID=1566151 RepID=A0ABQ9DJ81_9PASS|nr:hypothetical protein WISP_52090 [Willisornis vidua]
MVCLVALARGRNKCSPHSDGKKGHPNDPSRVRAVGSQTHGNLVPEGLWSPGQDTSKEERKFGIKVDLFLVHIKCRACSIYQDRDTKRDVIKLHLTSWHGKLVSAETFTRCPRLASRANPLLFATGSVLLYACRAPGVAKGMERELGLCKPSLAMA